MTVKDAALVLDRLDLGLSIQVWIHYFMRALDLRVVSNNENDWAASKESALEYLARSLMMESVGRFCDGVVSGVAQAGIKGMQVARDDVDALLADIDAKLHERTEALQTALRELGEQGRGELELARLQEITEQHRAWLGLPATPNTPQELAQRYAPVDPLIGAPADTTVDAAAEEHASRFYKPAVPAGEVDPETHAARFFRPGHG